jgi:hypothetical protein
MPKYVQVAVGDHCTVPVEVPSASERAVVEAGRTKNVASAAVETFSSTMDAITVAAENVIVRAGKLPQRPNELTIEFSVQLAAEAGVVVASTSATANMRVSFRWTS